MQGIIERTNDIDFTCSKEYYDKINWPTKIGAYGLEIKKELNRPKDQEIIKKLENILANIK